MKQQGDEGNNHYTLPSISSITAKVKMISYLWIYYNWSFLDIPKNVKHSKKNIKTLQTHIIIVLGINVVACSIT